MLSKEEKAAPKINTKNEEIFGEEIQAKKAQREQAFFSTGSFALAFAVLSITIAPFIVNYFMLTSYIPVSKFQITSGVFYAAALICYIFSSSHYQKQQNWILITFAYYIAFQVLAKMMS